MHPSLSCLAGVEIAKSYNQPGDFVFPSEDEGKETARLGSVLKKKIPPAFKRIGITGVGGHTFRHTVEHAGRDGRTTNDDSRLLASQRSARDQQYLQATTKSKRLAQGKLVDAILPGGVPVGKNQT